MKIAFLIIGLIFVFIGVICIYDARKLTKKLFSFQDINEGTKTLKIFGLIISILGLSVVYIYIPEALETLKSMKIA